MLALTEVADGTLKSGSLGAALTPLSLHGNLVRAESPAVSVAAAVKC